MINNEATMLKQIREIFYLADSFKQFAAFILFLALVAILINLSIWVG